MGLRTHLASLTCGIGGRLGAMKDQWGWYSAPAAIQRLRVSFWAGVSFLWVLGGGMTSRAEVAKMRSTRALLSGLPGSVAPLLMARSRLSRRRGAWRAALSG